MMNLYTPRTKKRISDHPLFYTLLYGTPGAVISVMNPENALFVGGSMLGLGLVGDLTRGISTLIRKWRWKSQDTDLAKVMDSDYFKALIETIKTEHGYRGKCIKIEAKGKQEGTGLFRGGYFTELDLKFRDGNQIKLLYKYSDKGNLSVGGIVSSYLNEKGFEFVPKRYVPRDTSRTRLDWYDMSLQRGQVYEYLEGDSLENMLVTGEKPTVEPTNVSLSGTVDKLFENMLRIYSHAQFGLSDEHLFGSSKLEQMFYDNPLIDRLGVSGLSHSSHRFHYKLINAMLGEEYIEKSRTLWQLEADLRFREKKTDDIIKILDDYLLGKKRKSIKKLKKDIESVQDALNKITSAEEFVSTYRLVESLRESYQKIEEKIPLRIIHGDLHQGNILVPDMQIIDWDSAQLGIAYQDFFHFSVISDFEKSLDYEEKRKEFLEKQQKLVPELNEEHKKLIEFETYLSLLNRYYDAVDKELLREEFNPNMLQSCKYLLDKSKKTLDDYVEIAGDEQLKRNYEKFCSWKFKKLDNVEFNPLASIAYAHSVNHKYRKNTEDDLPLSNYKKHMEKIQSMVILEERRRNTFLGNVAITIVAGGAVVAAAAYEDMLSELPPNFLPVLIVVPVAYVLAYNKERVFNLIDRIKGRKRTIGYIKEKYEGKYKK
ncbi:aminoglycoside phosphotransferase family protein [Candidatus Woesearchaeota archaeon]|nr:aminoglycoside phosphotransferase family protein [Candidatus Woesearchaeota archaeon]